MLFFPYASLTCLFECSRHHGIARHVLTEWVAVERDDSKGLTRNDSNY